MARIKRIGMFSFVKLRVVFMAVIGLAAGIVYSFGGLLVDALVSIGWVSATAAATSGLSYGTLLAFGALIGMPIIAAVFGLVLGFFEVLIYKLIIHWCGGIDLHIEVE